MPDHSAFRKRNRFGNVTSALRLFEIASVLVCFDQLARIIVNANHSIMRTTVKLCISDCVTALILPFAYLGALP